MKVLVNGGEGVGDQEGEGRHVVERDGEDGDDGRRLELVLHWPPNGRTEPSLLRRLARWLRLRSCLTEEGQRSSGLAEPVLCEASYFVGCRGI